MTRLISYLAAIEGRATKLKDEAQVRYCKYVPVTLGKSDITTAGLIDSGNLYRTVISKKLAARLHIDLQRLAPLRQTQVGTAKAGSNLRVLGQVREPLYLKLGDHPTRLAVRPVIIDQLAMPLNLSGLFCKAYGIDQLHSEDKIKFQGRTVRVYATAQDACPEGITALDDTVYVKEDTEVPPDSEVVVALRSPLVQDGTMRPGPMALRGSVHFMNSTDLHPMLNAVVEAEADGTVLGRVLNTTEDPVLIKAGTRYGGIEACYDAEQPEKPFSIMAMGLDAEPEDELEKAIAEGPEPVTALASSRWPSKKKRDFIRRAFRLNECDELRSESDIEKAETLLLQYWDVISAEGEYGFTDLVEHEIPTDPAKGPIKCKNRPMNPDLEADLKKQLIKWIKTGVITPSKSDYNFPVLAIPKKDGTLRYAIDYRLLNQSLKSADAFPMPNVEANLAKLAGSKVFSSLDNCGAFHAINIKKEDRHKTAFSACGRLWEFKQLSFGMATAPSTFLRLVERALGHLPTSQLITYVDDSLLHSPTLQEHFHVLMLVLKAYRKAGMKLSPHKCFLFRSEVDYLGFTVSKDGLKCQQKALDIIRKWPLPQTKTQVRAFIGKLNYYKKFFRHLSQHCKPWTDVMGKTSGPEEKSHLVVTPEMKASFEKLKQMLTSPPILAFPEFGPDAEMFCVDTDWSQDSNTVGGVLSQRQNGVERIILFGSKKLEKGRRHYSSFQGELLAVTIFLKMWRFYLYPKKFILRTDHQALKWIKTIEQPSAVAQRWLQTLANFNFEVQFRRTQDHGNADALSRIDHAEPEEPSDLDDEAYGLAALAPLVAPPFTPDVLKEAQEEDHDYQMLRRAVRERRRLNGQELRLMGPEGRHLNGLFSDLRLDHNDVLTRLLPEATDLAWTRGQVFCVPVSLQDQLIRHCHEMGGHQGRDLTLKRVAQLAFFPHMRTSVEHFVKACRDCVQADKNPKNQRHTLLTTQDAGYPMMVLSVDFVGALPKSKKGNSYIFTVKDVFSKYVFAFPLKKATAEAAADILEKEIFCKFGICEKILSDQGAQFRSRLWDAMGEVLGITIQHVASYNPKANMIERTHRDLGAMLRKMMDESLDWEDCLPQCLFAINTAKNRMTNVEPWRLMFGRLPATPLHVAFGNPPPTEDVGHTLSFQEYAKKLAERVEAAQSYARAHLRTAVERQRRVYNRDQKLFLVGQKVWLFNPAASQDTGSRKLTRYWSGPWLITDKVNDLTYVISPHAEMGTLLPEKIVSIDRLKIYRDEEPPPRLGRPVVPPPVGDDDSDDEYAEVVEDPPAPGGDGGGDEDDGGGDGALPPPDLGGDDDNAPPPADAGDLHAPPPPPPPPPPRRQPSPPPPQPPPQRDDTPPMDPPPYAPPARLPRRRREESDDEEEAGAAGGHDQDEPGLDWDYRGLRFHDQRDHLSPRQWQEENPVEGPRRGTRQRQRPVRYGVDEYVLPLRDRTKDPPRPRPLPTTVTTTRGSSTPSPPPSPPPWSPPPPLPRRTAAPPIPAKPSTPPRPTGTIPKTTRGRGTSVPKTLFKVPRRPAARSKSAVPRQPTASKPAAGSSKPVAIRGRGRPRDRTTPTRLPGRRSVSSDSTVSGYNLNPFQEAALRERATSLTSLPDELPEDPAKNPFARSSKMQRSP